MPKKRTFYSEEERKAHAINLKWLLTKRGSQRTLQMMKSVC